MTTSAHVPPPIKAKTEQKYSELVNSMFRLSSRKRTTDAEAPVPVTNLEVTQDLMERTDLGDASHKTYRAALIRHLQLLTEPTPSDIKAIELLRSCIRKTGPKRKSNRPKTIGDAHYVLLVDTLGEMAVRSRWAGRTQAWVQAGLATGIRPIEWIEAKWLDEEHTALQVVTAKQKISMPAFMRKDSRQGDLADPDETDDDAWHYPPLEAIEPEQAQIRTIPVARAGDRYCIEGHMAALEDALRPANGDAALKADLYAHYYAHCKLVLHRACKRIWKGERSYSLYTMRSQFSANQKAAVGPDATAELMGHSRSDSPAAAHYGKANQAHARFKGVRPSMFKAIQEADKDQESPTAQE